MALSMATALEIFTNPNDLDISIIEDDNSGKYYIEFCRGPGHNFKLMLSSQPFTEKLEDAVKTVRETLEAVHLALIREFDEEESIPYKYLNSDNQPIDQLRILTPELIARIVEELQRQQMASTWKLAFSD